ncbi:MAG: hypothetical protein ACRDTE_18070, partial [Pseudonocardiaceae bacterium]
MISSGAFYFHRLLEAIAELDHLAGRLEVSRVFSVALETSGAMSRPRPQNRLRLCEELQATDAFRTNWTLRRMLSRVLGDLVGLHLASDHITIARDFCDAQLESVAGSLMLAEAGVEHTAAASAIGSRVLQQLLASANPQIPWQLLRRWPIVSPILPALHLESPQPQRSASINRMFVVTRLQEAVGSTRELRDLLSQVSDAAAANSEDSPEESLHRALKAWVALNTAQNSSRSEHEIYRIDEVLYEATWKTPAADSLVSRIGQALELDS